MSSSNRIAFTLAELLVLLAILGISLGILFPVVQSIRESSLRTACAHNMREIGYALHNFESSQGSFPSAGQAKRGDAPGGSPSDDVFFAFDNELENLGNASLSFQCYILPFIEKSEVYNQMSFNIRYDDALSEDSTGQYGAKTPISRFLCPAVKGRRLGTDAEGFGFTDYSAPVTVRPNLGSNTKRFKCILNGDSDRSMRTILDGTSQTIAIAEVAGRVDVGSGGFMAIKVDAMSDGTIVKRRPWAWADPDNSFNVDKLVNNNSTPIGGPIGFSWDIDNCGPNQETFSFHPGGANVVFCDGTVRFILESIDNVSFAALLSKDGNEEIASDQW